MILYVFSRRSVPIYPAITDIFASESKSIPAATPIMPEAIIVTAVYVHTISTSLRIAFKSPTHARAIPPRRPKAAVSQIMLC